MLFIIGSRVSCITRQNERTLSVCPAHGDSVSRCSSVQGTVARARDNRVKCMLHLTLGCAHSQIRSLACALVCFSGFGVLKSGVATQLMVP